MALLGEGVRTYRLAYLRRKLSPVYGEHTDSVISLLGNRMHPLVLREARAGRLLNAHAYQQCPADYKTEWGVPTETLGWTGVADVPSWFSKPIHQGDAKSPELSFQFRPGDKSMNRLFAFAMIPHTLPVAHLAFDKGKIGDKVALYSFYLQKTMGGLSLSKLRTEFSGRALTREEGRRVDGWSDSLLKRFEQHAISSGFRRVAVVAGALGAIGPITTKPIHHQQLHLYGRLLMRRGYTLREVPDPQNPKMKTLFWVKDLRRLAD